MILKFTSTADYAEANERMTNHFKTTWDEFTIRYSPEEPDVIDGKYVISVNIGDEGEALDLLNGIDVEVEE